MSTRSTVFYDDEMPNGGGLHIYRELADDDGALYLEYTQGSFVVCFRLPDGLQHPTMTRFLAYLERKREEAKGEA